MPIDNDRTDLVCLFLLGQGRAVWQTDDGQRPLRVQPKPFRLLTYLALNWEHPHRREKLRALFWPDKPPRQAANNLRQALWHLRRILPPATLLLQEDVVQWNPDQPPWVDALVFEAALNADHLDSALGLYAGPLLPDAYDEWAQSERERLCLRYLAALETRAHQHYKARRWEPALDAAEALLSTDPLNESAARLVMACHWALGRRDAVRRHYEAFRRRLHDELQSDPLPETTILHQRILRGEAHPDQAPSPADETIATRRAHFSLLETLGAFRQGLEQATTWAAEASGTATAEALRWQGRFHMRLGQLADSRTALETALPLATTPDLQATVLADLATTETALGDYEAAEAHYDQALRLSPVPRVRLLSSLGGLQGRLGRSTKARRTLEEAVHLAQGQGDPATLAVASGNLGILLIGQGEQEAAEAMLQKALAAARRADAHWLTAHLTGHLGLLAEDRGDSETTVQHYQRARAITKTIGAERSAILWTLNLGITHYEQGQLDEALPLLIEGQKEATEQGSRNLEAGATIFVGACLVGQGKKAEGLARIEQGLALALDLGDAERILMGYLHQGRALIAMERADEAQVILQKGLHLAEESGMARLGRRIQAELENVSPKGTGELTPN
jgi:DNA-binding SARP family transcriptional activator/Tfp pilus assembly protein PilF